MTSELAGDLANWHLSLSEMIKTATIGDGELLIAKRHAKISKVKPLKLLACRTWK
jgi:hypothetical protein